MKLKVLQLKIYENKQKELIEKYTIKKLKNYNIKKKSMMIYKI